MTTGRRVLMLVLVVIAASAPPAVALQAGAELEAVQICSMLWTDASGRPRDNVLFPAEAQAAGEVLFEGIPIRPLGVFDLWSYEDGNPAPPGGAPAGSDIQQVRIGVDGLRLSIEFFTDQPPSSYPLDFRTAFEFPSGGGGRPCGWCLALRRWIFGTPVYAQQPTIFSGPDFRPALLISGLVEGPGRARVVASGGRAIPGGNVEVSGNRVRVSFPAAVAASLGLLRPGMRVIAGLVTRPPNGVFDRVPDVGSFQLGIPGFAGLDARNVVARFDTDGDGKDDVFYLDTNGNGLIDAAARDRNGDGQITFAAGDGPFVLIGRNNRPMEFSEVRRAVAGKRQVFALRNDQLFMASIVEDKNGSGRIDAEDELIGYLVPLR